MRLRSECIRCLLDKQLQHIPEDTPEEKKVEYLQRVLRRIGTAGTQESAPVIVRDITRIRKEMFGYEEDFRGIKQYYNQLMMEKAPDIRKKIMEAENPFRRALQYAMTGNYIDFGARHSVEDRKLEQLLKAAPGVKLPEEDCLDLEKDLEKARKVVYLTDNCGEVVLDKLLMEQMRSRYPQAELMIIVRGQAAVNDADLEDAAQVGLETEGTVLGNGNDIAGTWIKELAPGARKALEEADVILAKGQGNFETLQGCGLNIYYLFMCKCSMFTGRFHVKLFDGILVSEIHGLQRPQGE